MKSARDYLILVVIWTAVIVGLCVVARADDVWTVKISSDYLGDYYVAAKKENKLYEVWYSTAHDVIDAAKDFVYSLNKAHRERTECDTPSGCVTPN